MYSSWKLICFLGLSSTFVCTACSDYVSSENLEEGDSSVSPKYGIAPDTLLTLKIEGRVENIRATAYTRVLIFEKKGQKYLAGTKISKNSSFSLEEKNISLPNGEYEILLRVYENEEIIATKQKK